MGESTNNNSDAGTRAVLFILGIVVGFLFASLDVHVTNHYHHAPYYRPWR